MSVQPFKIDVPQEMLDDLYQRLANTRWPDEIEDASWNYGTNLAYLKKLCAYWLHGFDWREQEAKLNRFAHFNTRVDSLNIHFIHEYGKGPNPLPIVLTHGWPDSFFRFIKIIPLLTDPASYGGDPADSFDVVVPSMPGFGFSDHPLQRGMTSTKMAGLWTRLMTQELRYERFAAHGGDIGGGVTLQIAHSYPQQLVGIHLDGVPFRKLSQRLSDLTEQEHKFLEEVTTWQRNEGAYAAIQSTKPQTLNYSLSDSPAGLAGWIIEKFRAWSDCDGDVEKCFSKDELLTNIMIYWVTNTIGSANRYYYEAAHNATAYSYGYDEKIVVPTAIAIFPKDIVPAPRAWGERWFNIQRWTEMSQGGHFAALEEPELLVDDIRTYFRTLR